MKRKTVVLVFHDKAEKEYCIDYLLKVNAKFQAILNKNIVFVSQKVFSTYYLDLYLNLKSCASVI